jgi:hypothetical protein
VQQLHRPHFLKDEKPADLDFRGLLDRQLGLTLPTALLVRADKVIE